MSKTRYGMVKILYLRYKADTKPAKSACCCDHNRKITKKEMTLKMLLNAVDRNILIARLSF